jgi:hypothetical protein
MARRAGHLLGSKVVDAKRDCVLHITDHDIQVARAKDPKHCAAAVACKRQFHAAEARVNLGVTMIRRNGTWTRFRTPPSLVREITALDRGGAFAPGEYVMKAPPPSQRLGAKRRYGRGPGLKKGKKSKAIHVTVNVRARAKVMPRESYKH